MNSVKALLVVLAVGLVAACGSTGTPTQAEDSTAQGGAVPAAEVEASDATTDSAVAVLAGGCFWGVEAVFEHVSGVTDVVSGYAGGDSTSATYSAVTTGATSHAESVRVTYDPRQISYAEILQIYFAVAHDPTQLNRQGPDIGPQYRSTIFATDAEQARVARSYLDQLDRENVFGSAIATTIEMGATFYPAEVVHQDFMAQNPQSPYILEHDVPKLEALEKLFPERFES